MKGGIEIVNFQEANKFIEYESEMVEKTGWELLAETALKAMDAMKRYIEPSVVTGRLRASVHIETTGSRFHIPGKHEKTGERFPSEDEKFNENPDNDEILVGTNVIYADDVDKKGRAKGYFNLAAVTAEKWLDNQLRKQSSK